MHEEQGIYMDLRYLPTDSVPAAKENSKYTAKTLDTTLAERSNCTRTGRSDDRCLWM